MILLQEIDDDDEDDHDDDDDDDDDDECDDDRASEEDVMEAVQIDVAPEIASTNTPKIAAALSVIAPSHTADMVHSQARSPAATASSASLSASILSKSGLDEQYSRYQYLVKWKSLGSCQSGNMYHSIMACTAAMSKLTLTRVLIICVNPMLLGGTIGL